MLEPAESTFDFDSFFDNLSVVSKDGDRKHEKVSRNIKLAKEMVDKAAYLGKLKCLNKMKLSEAENELAKLRSNHQELLKKCRPLESELDEKTLKISELTTTCTQSQAELEAFQAHAAQLQALVKELQEKIDILSLEKSIASGDNKTNNKHIKHIILFGKLASKSGKLSIKNKNLLKKYLQDAGENYEATEDLDNMPPSCGSVDTGIGSSLMSDDEKLWSPDSQFTQSSTYEEIPPTPGNVSCDSNTIDEAITSTEVDTSTSPMKTQQNYKLISENETVKLVSSVGTNTVDSLPQIVSTTDLHWEKKDFSTRTMSPEFSKPQTKALLSVSTNTDCIYEKCERATSPIHFTTNVTANCDSPQHSGLKGRKGLNIVNVTKGDQCNEVSYDLEIENIFKEMALPNSLKPLTPIPSTPPNVRKVLRSKEQQINRNNKRLNMLKISGEVRRLKLTTHKMNKELCRQRRQMLIANKILLKHYSTPRIDSMVLNEDSLVKLLSIMGKASKRFKIEEREPLEPTRATINTDKFKKIHKEFNNFKNQPATAVDEKRPKKMSKSSHSKQHNKEVALFGDNSSDELDSSSNCMKTSENLHGGEISVRAPVIGACPEPTFNANASSSTAVISEDGESHKVQNIQHQRKRKMSKLDKFKNRFKQTSKISSDDFSQCSKRKRNVQNTAISSDNSITPLLNSQKSPNTLNNKEAYEKAIKVMAQMNEKANSKNDSEKSNCLLRVTRSASKVSPTKNNDNPNTTGQSDNGITRPGNAAAVDHVNTNDTPEDTKLPKLKSEVIICLQKLPIDTIEMGASVFSFSGSNNTLHNYLTKASEGQVILDNLTSKEHLTHRKLRNRETKTTFSTIRTLRSTAKESVISNELDKQIPSPSPNSNVDSETVDLIVKNQQYSRNITERTTDRPHETDITNQIINSSQGVKPKKVSTDGPQQAKIRKPNSPQKEVKKRKCARSSPDFDDVTHDSDEAVRNRQSKFNMTDYSDLSMFDCEESIGDVHSSTSADNIDGPEIIPQSKSNNENKQNTTSSTKITDCNISDDVSTYPRNLLNHICPTDAMPSSKHSLQMQEVSTTKVQRKRKSGNHLELIHSNELEIIPSQRNSNKGQNVLQQISGKSLRSAKMLEVTAISSKQPVDAPSFNKPIATMKNGIVSADSVAKELNRTRQIQNTITEATFSCNDNTSLNSICEIKVSGKSVEAQMNDQGGKSEFFKSILSKYGRRQPRKTCPVNFPDSDIEAITNILENNLGGIANVPTEQELDSLVGQLESKPHKLFVVSLVEFLMSYNRNKDIMCQAHKPRIPAMSKPEQALCYVLDALCKKWHSVDIVSEIMKFIDYKLFRLSFTPSIVQVENLARYFAVLCKLRKSRDHLRTFLVVAMYCMNYKSIPLIKQCLDVWMHTLPLAHMAQANTPLVLVLVYMVFYFRLDDHKSTDQVDALKKMLTYKYSYNMKQMTEQDVLQILRGYVIALKDNEKEKHLLATAFILIAKRKGVKWCQKCIVDEILTPIIDSKTSSDCAKTFSIALLGSLHRPYLENMKVYSVMTFDKLALLMQNQPSFAVEQAIVESLILLRRYNKYRVMNILKTWTPRGAVSTELMKLIKTFIQEVPLHVWIQTLYCNEHRPMDYSSSHV